MNPSTIWDAYQAGDPDAREQLLSLHLRLVHHVARRIARSLHIDVEFDDLLSAGTMGLINAVENFDPSRGLAFSTFAAPRIRGAILDELRRWDHVPRSVRRKQRQLKQAREALRAALDRAPNAVELARELDIELEQLWRWEADAHQSGLVSIDQPVDGEDGASAPLDVLVGEEADSIEDGVNHDQETERLRQEILNLKERERIVLSLYYFEELKLHEIATILNLTESRISQIRSKAISTLRSRMKSLREETV